MINLMKKCTVRRQDLPATYQVMYFLSLPTSITSLLVLTAHIFLTGDTAAMLIFILFYFFKEKYIHTSYQIVPHATRQKFWGVGKG